MICARARLRRLAGAAVLLVTGCFATAPVVANPQGAVVVAGSAQIGQPSPNRLDITQSTGRVVIDWNSFSIGAGEQTNFTQPSAAALAVNRVKGTDPSDIAGKVTANGQVVLVNPNGILFEKGSRVDAASFVATSSWISTEDAMAGRLAFAPRATATTGSVVNRGRITVKEGGLAALVAPGVVNDGVIRARLGKLALAAGDTFTIDLAGDRLIKFALDSNGLKQVTAPDGTPLAAAIANSGTLRADGGTIEISVDSAKGVVDRAINMTGIAVARSVRQQHGTILLDGGDSGTVSISGQLDAKGNRPGESGGDITVTGQSVALTGANIDASGQAGGGTIAIGGRARGAGSLRNASRTAIDATSILRADAAGSGPGGSVVVWSDADTSFSGTISARGGPAGGNGGSAEVSSHGLLDFHGTADLRAPLGSAGTLLLDPNDVVIQSGGTTTRPLIGTSILTVGDLQNELALGNVEVTTGLPAVGTQPGDITIANDVTWSSGNSLTLSAYHDIAINAQLSSSNTGTLTLRADNTGTGGGTIRFGSGGAIQASGGAVNLYFNSNDNTNNIATNLQSYVATQSYAGNVSGASTLNQYALVNTVFDLANINNNSAGTYALGRSIDASPITNFTMIASLSGVLDGQGQTIDRLTINSGLGGVGLFSQLLPGSTVRNLSLTNLDVTATAANSNVGGLAGLASGSITNVRTGGAVTATAGGAVGGLIGRTDSNATISQSSSAAAVTGGSNTGGLVGMTSANTGISQSFASGAVSAPGANAGGLVGQNSGGISDSYTTGAVGGGTAGGLIGVNSAANPNAVDTVLAAGAVTGTSTAGGLVGEATSTTNLHNSVWDTTATGQMAAGGNSNVHLATGLTTSVLQNGTLPSGFASTVWFARSGAYPALFGARQSVSGTVLAGPGGLPLSGATVRLVVDGVDSGLTATTTAGGFYSFDLPGNTIAGSGSNLLAVLTGGGSGNAFLDGATGSIDRFDLYGSNFLTLYTGTTSLSAAAGGLHSAAGGSTPPSGIANSLLFSPTNTTTLSLNSGAGLWLNPTSPQFQLDAPIAAAGASKVILAATGSISESPAGSIASDQLLLLGNGGTYTLPGGTVPNKVGTLAASTGAVDFSDGDPANSVDLTTGTIFGVAGAVGSGVVALRASDNLVLASGAPVAGSGTATAVTLFAGGAFTNNAGAAAITAGGGGRFLVYSQNPANDNRGGLAYAFKQYDATPTSPVLGSGNGFLYSIAPTLALTAVGKTYDGTTALPGPSGFTVGGGIDNDLVTLTGLSGNYDDKNVGTAKLVNLTGSAITTSDPTGATVFGYQVTPAAGGAIGTITPAPLTITAIANSKTFDGTTNAAGLPTIAAGTLLSGDSAVLSETYADLNAGTGKTLLPSATISDGNGGTNYAVTLLPNLSGVISQAPLAIVAANASRDFGQPNPVLGGIVSGLVGGDTDTSIGLVYATTAMLGSPPGSYPITATIASGNYIATITPGTLLINPATTSQPSAPGQPTTGTQSTITMQPTSFTVSTAATQQTVLAAIEQASHEPNPVQNAFLGATALPGQPDFISRIVEGFENKLLAPRQALFVVLPNPDGTVGAITVDDGKTQTLLDRPYAAIEMHAGEAAAAEIGPDDVSQIVGTTAATEDEEERKRRKARGQRARQNYSP